MSAHFGSWLLQGPGWLFVIYLVVAQCVSAVRYEAGVRMGTQEPADRITPVGRAFFWGFAFADLVADQPKREQRRVEHPIGAGWTELVLGAGPGITIYWPIVCLAGVCAARGAPGWSLPKEGQYRVALPLIAVWGLAGLIVLWPGG